MLNHCPGIENPADIGSRGQFASNLKSNRLWWKGPTWLSELASSWPRSEDEPQPVTEEFRTELRKGAAGKGSDVALLLTTDSRPDLEACIPVTSFSCCDTLFRVAALVLRFVRNLKIKAKML